MAQTHAATLLAMQGSVIEPSTPMLAVLLSMQYACPVKNWKFSSQGICSQICKSRGEHIFKKSNSHLKIL